MKLRKSLCGLNTRLSYSSFTVICAQITLILTSIVYLLFYYHSASYKNAGVYIQNARMLWHGENPYISGTARWGQFGQFFLLGISNLIKFNFAPSIFQILNLIGIYLFIKTFIPKHSNLKINYIFLIVIWASSTREILSNNQITGILLGLAAASVLIYRHFPQKKIAIVTSTLLSAIVLDLKPHIFLIFIIALYFTEIPPKYLLLVINWILLSHLYFDLKMRRILELDLLKRILAIGSNPTTTNPVKAGGEDSGNLWPLLNRIFSRNLSFSLISIILIIILSIIFFVNLKKMHHMQLIFAAFAIPFFGTYFHYYDSVALVILGIYILVNSSNLSIIFVVFALDFLLIAHQFTKITNILFVLIISTVVMKIKETVLDRKIIVRFLLGHVAYFTISILNIHLFQPGHLFNSLITTETFIVLLFLYYKKFKKILQ